MLLTVTEDTVITDCDMFFTDNIEGAFEYDFDVGYTKRNYKNSHITGMNKPLNGGVFFFRPTEQAKSFVENWYKVCESMTVNDEFYQEWFKKYAGLNQTALGYLLDTDSNTNIKQFNCAEYNGCAEDLLDFNNKKPKIVHIKSPLWQIMAGITIASEERDTDGFLIKEYKEVISYWRNIYNDSCR